MKLITPLRRPVVIFSIYPLFLVLSIYLLSLTPGVCFNTVMVLWLIAMIAFPVWQSYVIVSAQDLELDILSHNTGLEEGISYDVAVVLKALNVYLPSNTALVKSITNVIRNDNSDIHSLAFTLLKNDDGRVDDNEHRNLCATIGESRMAYQTARFVRDIDVEKYQRLLQAPVRGYMLKALGYPKIQLPI